jgi:hypothetical protein
MNNQQLTSLRTLLSGIIDYAGLYPPASLPLDEAIRNFVKYQTDSEAWMLSRFIIPAKRLSELSKLAGIFSKNKTLSFSCLGRGGKAIAEFVEYLKFDIEDIQTFRALRGLSVVVDMFETTLPVSALKDKFSTSDLVNKATDVLNKNGLTVFFEAPFDDKWQLYAENLIRALRKIKDKHVGFKLRTGGVTPETFPSTEQVAWAIATTRDAGVPLKATAGLHHPIRHYNESVKTKMHGFLNVFGAGVLAVTNNLSQEQIQSIIEDEDPSHFVFGEDGFVWNDLRVANKEIKHARGQIISFGSCSFDEPREDLQKLGIL